MYKPNSQRDLNQCTTRQLTSVPGVDKKLADAIVRYRQNHGRLNHFDDLWQVRGITRSKFQLLRRHFKVAKEKQLNLLNAGSKLPYAKLSLTESMVDFVCQGQAQRNNSAAKNPENTFLASLGKKTKGRHRSRQDEFESTSLQAKSGVPITKVLAKKTTTLAKSSSQGKNDESTDAPYEQANMPALPNDTDLLQTLVSPRYRNGWVTSPRPVIRPNNDDVNPSVTLETSPDGDNINFSCTIDKRILRHPTSVAFQLTQANPKLGHSRNNDNKLTPPAEIDVDLSQDVSIECEHCMLTGSPHAQCVHNHLPILGRSDQYQSMLTGTTSSSGSRLSFENMMLYEKRNTPDEEHRNMLIEAWVTNVNDARRLNRLLQGRERMDTKPMTSTTKSTGKSSHPHEKHVNEPRREPTKRSSPRDHYQAHLKSYNPNSQSDQRTVPNLFGNDNTNKRRSTNAMHSAPNNHTRKPNYTSIGQIRHRPTPASGNSSKENNQLHYCNLKGDFHENQHRRPTILSLKSTSRDKTDSVLYRHRMYTKVPDK